MNIDVRKWLEFIQTSSIPLTELGDNDLPVGLGAGCLIDYKGRRMLLSVVHVTKRSGRWVIPLCYRPELGKTEIYYLRHFNYLAEMQKGIPVINEVDFSFVEVLPDLTCRFQHWTPAGQCLIDLPRTIFRDEDIAGPELTETYGFASDVKPEFSDADNALIMEHQTYPGLKYMKTEDHYHCFRLPVKHPGHASFKGCSGTPIVDTKHRIVGLVSGGSIENDEIYAIDLLKHVKTIDLLYKALSEMNAQPNAAPDRREESPAAQ